MRVFPSIRAAFLVLCVVAGACGDDDLGGLAPRLAARDDQPTDPADANVFRLDFGNVAVGGRVRRDFELLNLGRAPLTLDTPVVAAPFLSASQSVVIAAQGSAAMPFVFAPTAAGPAEQRVTLTSDGGELVVTLVGNGIEGDPGECQFQLSPHAIDFGEVARGQTAKQSFRVINAGSGICKVTRLSLDPAGSAAFSLAGGAIPTKDIASGTELAVEVAFKPDTNGLVFNGKVQFWLGPPDSIQVVTLTGRAPVPCPNVQPDGSCPVAREAVYVNTASELFSYDAAAGTVQRVGAFKVGSASLTGVSDIAIDGTGRMLGVTMGQELYAINPANAACTLVGRLANNANGLTFLPDGRLVASGAGVWAIDRANGRITGTIVPPGRFATSGDIIGLPDGKLYWAVEGATSDDLVRIDPANGATTRLGNTGVNEIYGLGFANGVLYGYTSGAKSIVIDSSNGSVTSTRTVNGVWWGATTNPVRWGAP